MQCFSRQLGVCAAAIVMSLLAHEGDNETVKGLQGYAFASPLLRFKEEVVPPPVVMAAVRVVAALFPKCAPLLK